jgi:hypothetical protein
MREDSRSSLSDEPPVHGVWVAGASGPQPPPLASIPLNAFLDGDTAAYRGVRLAVMCMAT